MHFIENQHFGFQAPQQVQRRKLDGVEPVARPERRAKRVQEIAIDAALRGVRGHLRRNDLDLLQSLMFVVYRAVGTHELFD